MSEVWYQLSYLTYVLCELSSASLRLEKMSKHKKKIYELDAFWETALLMEMADHLQIYYMLPQHIQLV